MSILSIAGAAAVRQIGKPKKDGQEEYRRGQQQPADPTRGGGLTTPQK